MIAGRKICTTLALTFPFHCAIIRIAKIRQGLGVKTSGPFFHGRAGLYPFTRPYIEGSGSEWIQRRCGQRCRI